MPDGAQKPPSSTPAPEPSRHPDQARSRGQRNLVLALSLAAFIIIVYLVTILRIGGSLANRTF